MPADPTELRARGKARIAASCLVATDIALQTRPAAAEAPDLLQQPFYAALGSFILDSDTKVRLDGSTGDRGTTVDWEETFGGANVTRFRIDGYWRFGERHKIRALWFNSSRSEGRVLDDTIDWGDQEFPVDARVEGTFSFDVYELAYEYAFLHRENYELAGTIGLHYTELETKLAAKAETSNGTLDRDIEQSASVGAPLPVIGVRGMWRLPRAFWLDASAQFFKLSFNEFDGSLTDYRLAAFWQPKTWLGLGIGYNQFSVRVDVDRDRFDGRLEWTYRGPMLFYCGAF